MADPGIRPDEANWLEYRDVEIVEDDATGETILEIQVRGKRGVGYCKSTTGAVRPFQRMIERNQPQPTDRLFPADHKKQFNRILEEEGLKVDRQGNRRTLYSLRHSYISFRLLEGADIYQIAKNNVLVLLVCSMTRRVRWCCQKGELIHAYMGKSHQSKHVPS